MRLGRSPEADPSLEETVVAFVDVDADVFVAEADAEAEEDSVGKAVVKVPSTGSVMVVPLYVIVCP